MTEDLKIEVPDDILQKITDKPREEVDWETNLPKPTGYRILIA